MRASEAGELFDANAASYDRINTVISLGLDRRWRRWAAEKAVDAAGVSVLDVMTGAGELALEAASMGARVTGVDVSPGMLAEAQRQARFRGLSLELHRVDVTEDGSLPERYYHSAVISFGLRYAEDPSVLLERVASAVRPGGRVVVLEFCVPGPGVSSDLASAYFFSVLPQVASRLGDGPRLYEVLGETTRSLGRRSDIIEAARAAGLAPVVSKSMGFGMVLGLVLAPHEGAS